jgi:hypothetical protein
MSTVSKIDYAALGVHPTKCPRELPGELRYWQNDVVGAQAVVEAAKDLIAGKIVRFAKLKPAGRPGEGWAVANVVAFQEDTTEETGNESGMPYRIHDKDGDPVNGYGSHAIPFYPRYAVDELAELSVAMAVYLGSGWMRLTNRPS